jgi:hypothetical protein
MAKRTSKQSAQVAPRKKAVPSTKWGAATPRLLAGGNPQIVKADGDAPVQAYIAAMPGWKRDVGRRLDAIIVRTVPDVRKAVKWNSPFYGVEGQGGEGGGGGGWFLAFHCLTKHIKVAFFRGASLHPLPPGESKLKDVRYLDIHEHDTIDEAHLAMWIQQAAALPGFSSEAPARPTIKKSTSGPKKGKAAPSQLTDARVAELGDWRGEMLARVRAIMKQADPDVVEEVKWRKPSNSMRGVPVWSHDGIICTGETYNNAVKLTFAKGATLADPAGLFNSSLEGNTRRAIDLHEGETINEKALTALIRAAVALNTSVAKGRAKQATAGSAVPVRSQKRSTRD